MKYGGLRIVAYEPGHLHALRPRAYERGFLAYVGDLDTYGRALAVPGRSFTGLRGGTVVACAGIVPLYRGVGEAWLAFSEAFIVDRPSRLWALVYRAIGEGLDAALTDGFHRIQTAIPVGFEQGHAWARRLGFEEEGLMKKYGPDGHDFIRYGRIS